VASLVSASHPSRPRETTCNQTNCLSRPSASPRASRLCISRNPHGLSVGLLFRGVADEPKARRRSKPPPHLPGVPLALLTGRRRRTLPRNGLLSKGALVHTTISLWGVGVCWRLLLRPQPSNLPRGECLLPSSGTQERRGGTGSGTRAKCLGPLVPSRAHTSTTRAMWRLIPPSTAGRPAHPSLCRRPMQRGPRRVRAPPLGAPPGLGSPSPHTQASGSWDSLPEDER
jgi:hypothetical protein